MRSRLGKIILYSMHSGSISSFILICHKKETLRLAIIAVSVMPEYFTIFNVFKKSVKYYFYFIGEGLQQIKQTCR